MIQHRNSWLFKLPLLRNYDAIVLGRHAFFKGIPRDPMLIDHELVHQAQMDKHGILGFYLIYLKDYIVNLIRYRNHDLAYRNIPFEKEAYNRQLCDDCGGSGSVIEGVLYPTGHTEVTRECDACDGQGVVNKDTVDA